MENGDKTKFTTTEVSWDLDVPLLPVQRRQLIIDFLHRHGAVTLQQLANALRVSLSTLRRDLDGLH